MVSLEDIARQFEGLLLPSSTELAFNRRRGRYTTKTAHRCPGNNRIEITLTADVTQSAIVSHLTPTPHEICPVCKEVVKDAEIFACLCGGEGKLAHKHDSSYVLTLQQITNLFRLLGKCPRLRRRQNPCLPALRKITTTLFLVKYCKFMCTILYYYDQWFTSLPHSKNKFFLIIHRLKSKEKFSAISEEKIFKIVNDWS